MIDFLNGWFIRYNFLYRIELVLRKGPINEYRKIPDHGMRDKLFFYAVFIRSVFRKMVIICAYPDQRIAFFLEGVVIAKR